MSARRPLVSPFGTSDAPTSESPSALVVGWVVASTVRPSPATVPSVVSGSSLAVGSSGVVVVDALSFPGPSAESGVVVSDVPSLVTSVVVTTDVVAVVVLASDGLVVVVGEATVVVVVERAAVVVVAAIVVVVDVGAGVVAVGSVVVVVGAVVVVDGSVGVGVGASVVVVEGFVEVVVVDGVVVEGGLVVDVEFLYRVVVVLPPSSQSGWHPCALTELTMRNRDNRATRPMPVAKPSALLSPRDTFRSLPRRRPPRSPQVVRPTA